MATSLDVEKQCFEFGDLWKIAFKYDDTAFYRTGPERLDGTRAVDVAALHEKSGLLLLEAKDFRGHRIENSERIKSGEIAVEVALKARDTVAGLVGANRNEVGEFNSAALYDALKRKNELTVVLWLEDDVQQDERRAKQQMSALSGKLKEKLSWLKVNVFVLSSRTPNRLPDLKVRNLPGAGQS